MRDDRPGGRLLMVAAVVLALVTACGTTGAQTATDEGPSPTTATPTSEPTPEPPPFPDGTELQYADSSGEWGLVFNDVRVTRHDGFDRVEMGFAGTGVPGWAVNYVEQPVQEGSGEPIAMEGDSYLYVSASGTTWPADGYYDGPDRLGPEGGVREVYVGGTFEGYTGLVVGLDGPRTPFRVFTLEDPARLVVDVSDVEGAS